MKGLVGQTSGFLPRDLQALVADAGANLYISQESETKKINSLSDDLHGVDIHQASQIDNSTEKLTAKEDFTKALDRSKKRNASALGAPKVTFTVFLLWCFLVCLSIYETSLHIFLLLEMHIT